MDGSIADCCGFGAREKLVRGARPSRALVSARRDELFRNDLTIHD